MKSKIVYTFNLVIPKPDALHRSGIGFVDYRNVPAIAKSYIFIT